MKKKMKKKRFAIHLISLAFCFWPVSAVLWAQSPRAVEAAYPISQPELKASLGEIEGLAGQGDLLEAKSRYEVLLQHDLSKEDRSAVQEALGALNIKILFSPVPAPDSFFYTVKPGDSLYRIARKYRTTVELIRRSNRLSRDRIQPGMKLKISEAVYTIRVDKGRNELSLYAGEELLKTYPVATGTGGRTPSGTFTIVNKLEHPVWYKAGAAVPAGSPENILGTRWLGFSLASYGIHGTTLPETIGTHATEGCVRMYNRDVEELYDIVPAGTQVTVADSS